METENVITGQQIIIVIIRSLCKSFNHYSKAISVFLNSHMRIKFLPGQCPWIRCKCLRSNFIHSKIFQSDRIQRTYCKKFAIQHVCRNTDLNLILISATNNRFINWILVGTLGGFQRDKIALNYLICIN